MNASLSLGLLAFCCIPQGPRQVLKNLSIVHCRHFTLTMAAEGLPKITVFLYLLGQMQLFFKEFL